MGQDTGIQWAHHTWNPWRGCAKVSEGCKLCYAAAFSGRNPAVLGVWGPQGTRPGAAESYWRQPSRWDRAARAAGERRRVFCGSLMDFFEDREDLAPFRRRAWTVIAGCTGLDWLLLTKRPENIARMLPPRWGTGWHHVWLGCSVENRQRAEERIDLLAAVPATLHFLSCEPLLEPVELTPWLLPRAVQWVIVGGESSQGGERARPFDISWAEEIVNQCRACDVPVFCKQMGSVPVSNGLGFRLPDAHGGDWSAWPDWLRVREVPGG